MIRVLFLFLFSFPALAADYTWTNQTSTTRTFASASSACYDAVARAYQPSATVQFDGLFAVSETIFYCKVKLCSTSTGTCSAPNPPYVIPYSSTRLEARRSGTSCPTGKTYDAATGSCVAPVTCDASKGEELVNGSCVVTNQCAAKKDQATPTWEEFASADAYRASCKVSVGGCQVDTCSGSTPTECATDGKTGKMACWGAGKFTGEKSTGTDDATAAQPPKPEPTVTGQSQTCAAPTVSGSTTTYTCITESTATESAGSSCAVGTVNGVQGLHCTKPDYVPEHDSKKREDQVTEVTNPDGSKTTTTTSTTTTTHCASGACNTTTNVTTTTSGKDANGNPTGTTTTCKGDNCDNPTTPGKDESEEEDEEEGTAAPFVPGDKGDYLPEIGGGDEAPTYAESLDDFTDRVSNAPIVRGLTSITVPSSGTCSMGSAQLFGGSVSFNDFCTMAPQVLAGLRYLFLAIWAWAAIRLFFTA